MQSNEERRGTQILWTFRDFHGLQPYSAQLTTRVSFRKLARYFTTFKSFPSILFGL